MSKLVEQTPGYHIDAEGFVYSDEYSAQHIANLRKRIDRRVLQPAASGGRGDQAAADHALARDGQGGADDPRVSNAAYRHTDVPEERADGQENRQINGFSTSRPVFCTILSSNMSIIAWKTTGLTRRDVQ